MLKLICSLFASSVLVLVSFSANASSITINSSNLVTRVYDGAGTSVSDVDSSVSFGSRSLLVFSFADSSATEIN